MNVESTDLPDESIVEKPGSGGTTDVQQKVHSEQPQEELSQSQLIRFCVTNGKIYLCNKLASNITYRFFHFDS